MGSCLSKKSTSSSCAATAVEKPSEQTKSNVQVVLEKKKVEEETVKKEIFIIKHRKSNEIDRKVVGEEKCEVKKGVEVAEMAKNGSSNNTAMNAGGVLGLGPGSGVLVAAPVRTSSCTKEEVDAILIQCGRLSRSSSTGKAALSASAGSGENGNSVQRGRKYSGSKRSYDFDYENGSEGDRRRGNGGEIDGHEDNGVDDDNVLVVGERSNRHRQRQRQSRSVGSPSSKGRRRTPSRERDQAQQQQRSGSRERVSSGSGRRVSRSPGRRSESPITTTTGVTAANSSSSANANSSNNVVGGGSGGRPGKMVSVPATVSSLAIDKSNNAGGTETISASAVKRIQVKRNVGCDAAVGSRTVASPRARSPARISARASSENQNTNSAQNLQQPVSLSRSNSRKAEQSPYRRNPLGEIDTNVIVAVEQMPVPGLKVPNNASQQAAVHKLNADNTVGDNRVNKTIVDKNLVNVGCKAKEPQPSVIEEVKNPQANNNNVAVNVVGSGSEILKPSHGGVTRSRSSRLSRDLDIIPEALSNAAPSYTALLLEDIQNFHHKNNNTTTTPAFTLPACVSKACSILEAVADLNSSTGSNFSASAAAAFSDDKRRIPSVDQFSKLCDNASFGAPLAVKKGVETKDPFMQSEVVVGDDDLLEPSFHKYVTVRRGGTLRGEDMEEQESSGSNSFVSGQQHWASSSWEPNSADSTDCWTSSSRSNCREDSRSPVVPFQRFAVSSEPGYYDADEARKRLSGKKRDSDQQQNGTGRGRLGSGGIQSLPAAAAN